MSAPLDELSELLGRWSGRRVAVRVVGESGDLAAVFPGRLGAQSYGKRPAAFWPLETADSHGSEQPGVYAHPDLLRRVAVHEGGWVVEYGHGPLTINIRRLDPS